jgi:hypothetical protein
VITLPLSDHFHTDVGLRLSSTTYLAITGSENLLCSIINTMS